jgi:cytochrome c peroxidase
MRTGKKATRRAACALCVIVVGVAAADVALPPVESPSENPPSEAKRVLGKMLFFEEQLSSDDTVACATCHVMSRGGTDPRRGRNPGSNAVFGDLGDVMGSPGVEPLGTDGTFHPVPEFGTSIQVTPRTAPTPFAAPYEKEILWDGRAESQFTDPVGGQVVIASGGALESQALLPLTNPVEMGNADRGLSQVTAKLAASRPLALASDLPPDLALALDGEPSYPELFRRAFGDDAVTPARIAMAIATYERTLVADQTKYDRYVAGDPTALSEPEARGLKALTTSQCTKCHAPPLFSDGSFRATGVRDPKEDKGRAKTTGNDADRGKFKVPTLRNVVLKSSFFHDGQRTELGQAIDFYAVEPGPVVNGVRLYGSPSGGHHANVPSEQFADNQDPIMPTIQVSPDDAADIATFLGEALVDPRLAAGMFPFDAPTLASQRPVLQAIVHGPGRAASADVPQVVVHTPAYAGSESFSVAISGGRAGSTARLLSWEVPSPDGSVHVSDPIVLSADNGVTFGSTTVSLAAAKPDSRLQFAWRVDDPGSPGGAAVSPTASVVVFSQRPSYSGGLPVPAPAQTSVGDGDAYVESAKFSVDWRRADALPPKDAFQIVAWLGAAAPGANLADGTVTLSVGGTDVLAGAALDAKGRISAPGATGSYNATTGKLQVALRGIDLRKALVTPYSVPVRVAVQGLGLATPAATTVLSFDTKGDPAGALTGRFSYRASGTGNGVFHVTAATAKTGSDGRVRVRLSAALDTPGPIAAWTPGAVTLQVGAYPGWSTSQGTLGVSADGTTYAAATDADLRKLRIDVLRRTLELDVTAALPALSGLAPGTRVAVPVTLTMQPSTTAATVTFRTTATVTVARK